MTVKAFFEYARERHATYLRRAAGEPRPWSKDPILQTYRFTNVFRELDKTTVWFRENVRDKLRDKPEVLLATVVFRMLNRIATGEAIFLQEHLNGRSAFETFLESGETKDLRHAILTFCGRGPYVTGGYIISTPPGFNKLDGVMEILDQFASEKRRSFWNDSEKWGWKEAARRMLSPEEPLRMENVWDWLRQFPYLGSFHSYEIVCDLRYTALLENAPDRCTWGNPGPGARRGLNRVHGRPLKEAQTISKCIAEMRELLEFSRDPNHWPQLDKSKKYSMLRSIDMSKELPQKPKGRVDGGEWPAWELREVEHTLCEFDKYSRVKLGEVNKNGKACTPRGRFA